jgi:hypothetical protein
MLYDVLHWHNKSNNGDDSKIRWRNKKIIIRGSMMIRVYTDESGRITRRYKGQRYFVMAYVLTKDSRRLHKRFKQARLEAISHDMNRMRCLQKGKELKGCCVAESVKSKIYDDLLTFYKSNKTFEIALMVVDNKNLQSIFRKNKARSFNYFMACAIKLFNQEASFAIDTPDTLLLIDDRNVSPKSKSSLHDFLNIQLQFNDKIFKNEIRASYFNSKNEKLIQLADFVANTASRALNNGSIEAKENLNLLTPLLIGGKIFEFGNAGIVI